MNRVEDPVDELHRFLVGKFAGEFQRLVDDHRRGRPLVSHFIDGEPQDIGGNCWHTLHPPEHGFAREAGVDFANEPNLSPPAAPS